MKYFRKKLEGKICFLCLALYAIWSLEVIKMEMYGASTVANETSTCDADVPCGCWFQFQLLHFRSSSMLMTWENGET